MLFRSATRWAAWIADAELERPRTDLGQNGFTVTALQAAWHAIVTTSAPEGSGFAGRDHLVAALQAAVAIGGDTDTVAAVTGGLAGALYGLGAIPARWTDRLHVPLPGWPDTILRRDELTTLARRLLERSTE